MPKIHPSAIVSSEARLHDSVEVGPYAVIEGEVTLGEGCVIQTHARLIGPLTMGARNIVYPFASIGDWPQDRKFKGDRSYTLIGDDNVFREYSTIHRGTMPGSETRIGSRCYFMVSSHVGHNCVLADDVMLVNGAALGGHVHIGHRAMIGAYTAVHQFCRVGRLAMITNHAGFNMDVPPFFISMSINTVTQLNAVGLRRSGMSKESINALRRMFQLAFRQNRRRPLAAALAALPDDLKAVKEVAEMIEFVRTTKRGVAGFKAWSRRKGLDSVEPETE